MKKIRLDWIILFLIISIVLGIFSTYLYKASDLMLRQSEIITRQEDLIDKLWEKSGYPPFIIY
jgi:preprotein translocase subunit SecG